jgi:glutathione S-transferase
MEYRSVAEAREMPGLRLVLTAGVPGPWGEAAKAVFRYRNVDFTPVEQVAMQPNAELLAWTGHRNAPVAVYEDEPAITGWLEMVYLAERIGSGPLLFPAEERERVLALGYLTEIAGRGGLGWHRRLQLCAPMLDAPDPDNPGLGEVLAFYGVSRAALAHSSARMIAILDGLSEQLAQQRARGLDCLVGARVTALDLYWACFSMMLDPLPAKVNPMPDWLRDVYGAAPEEVKARIDPALIDHRDRVYREVIGLPLDY